MPSSNDNGVIMFVMEIATNSKQLIIVYPNIWKSEDCISNSNDDSEHANIHISFNLRVLKFKHICFTWCAIFSSNILPAQCGPCFTRCRTIEIEQIMTLTIKLSAVETERSAQTRTHITVPCVCVCDGKTVPGWFSIQKTIFDLNECFVVLFKCVLSLSSEYFWCCYVTKKVSGASE